MKLAILWFPVDDVHNRCQYYLYLSEINQLYTLFLVFTARPATKAIPDVFCNKIFSGFFIQIYQVHFYIHHSRVMEDLRNNVFDTCLTGKFFFFY